jgi:hypothetical protein
MSVTKGKIASENLNVKLKKEADEEKRLTEMMIPKKHKRLYGKIMYAQKKKQQEVTFKTANCSSRTSCHYFSSV